MPLNDEYMIYDYRKHRYMLTEKAVLELLGENLNDLTDGNVTLKNKLLMDASADVYGYIYEDSRSPDYIERIMALDEDLRPTIQDMLLAQLEYTLYNGKLSLYAGINLAKQSALDISRIRNESKVAETVVQETHRILPGYGICLKYCGRLPSVCPSQRYKGY
ncbi:MAG: hypothetical protein HFE33_05255 [Clostridia bacterium]|nr:hypothetical protein [Clostridia bacterium]